MAGLIGAAVNLSACAGHMYAGNDAHSRAMRRRTLRYLCLAFSLVFSEARREVDLQPFVEADMLMPEERKVLEALPQRAQAVCGWLWHHFHVAALDDKRAPPPRRRAALSQRCPSRAPHRSASQTPAALPRLARPSPKRQIDDTGPYAKNVSTFQWQGQLFAFRRMIADCHMCARVCRPRALPASRPRLSTAVRSRPPAASRALLTPVARLPSPPLHALAPLARRYVGVQLPLPYAAFLTLVVKATMAVTVLNAALDVRAASPPPLTHSARASAATLGVAACAQRPALARNGHTPHP